MPLIRCKRCGHSISVAEEDLPAMAFCEACGFPFRPGAEPEAGEMRQAPGSAEAPDDPVAPSAGGTDPGPAAAGPPKRPGVRRPLRRRPTDRHGLTAPVLTPGGVRIGPLDFGGVLNNAFTLLFRNLRHYVVLGLAVAFPILLAGSLLNHFFQASAQNRQDLRAFFVGILLSGVFGLIAGAFLNGCLAHSVAKQYLEEPVGIGESVQRALSRLLVILAATILWTLLAASGFVGSAVFLLIGPIGIALTAFAALIWIAGATYIVLVFYVNVPAIMLEHVGPWDALKRSAALMDGIKLRTFGVVFIVQLISMAVAIPIAILGAITAAMGGEIVIAIVNPFVQTVTSLLWSSVVVVTYFDGRVRHDGFGFENLAELFD